MNYLINLYIILLFLSFPFNGKCFPGQGRFAPHLVKVKENYEHGILPKICVTPLREDILVIWRQLAY